MTRNKFTALLPIKANSDRVPGKNFKYLGARPLFEWILSSLISSEYIEEIIINTDSIPSFEHSKLALNKKVTLKERPIEICGDFVSMNKVIEHDVLNSEKENFLMTHTTNPFISTKTLNSAFQEYLNALKSENFDSLFSVNKIQSRFYYENAKPVNHNPEELLRTQDLEPWFEENSCIYIFSKTAFLKNNSRIGLKPLMYRTPPLESIDIDNKDDWDLASALAETK